MDGTRLWTSAGGSTEGPLLLLLHGLGANSHVFDGMIREAESRWPGGWTAPDLAGHGRSAWLAPYTFDGHAENVAALLDRDRPTVVVGHSMGGVVALELASARYGATLRGLVGLGIKVAWTDEELSRAALLAEREVQVFPTREAAVERFLKISGLVGLATPDSPVVTAGVQSTADGWIVTCDPRGFAVGSPDMPRRMSNSACPVRLARGESDQLVSTSQLRELDPRAIELPGVGHNAHVQDPGAVLDLARTLLAS